MSDFLTRLKTEKEELDLKLSKLDYFRDSSEFNALPSRQQWLLDRQSEVMASYSRILEARMILLQKF